MNTASSSEQVIKLSFGAKEAPPEPVTSIMESTAPAPIKAAPVDEFIWSSEANATTSNPRPFNTLPSFVRDKVEPEVASKPPAPVQVSPQIHRHSTGPDFTRRKRQAVEPQPEIARPRFRLLRKLGLTAVFCSILIPSPDRLMDIQSQARITLSEELPWSAAPAGPVTPSLPDQDAGHIGQIQTMRLALSPVAEAGTADLVRIVEHGAKEVLPEATGFQLTGQEAESVEPGQKDLPRPRLALSVVNVGSFQVVEPNLLSRTFKSPQTLTALGDIAPAKTVPQLKARFVQTLIPIVEWQVQSSQNSAELELVPRPDTRPELRFRWASMSLDQDLVSRSPLHN